MGLLDDAIREHLELKRQHGADSERGRAPGAARRSGPQSSRRRASRAAAGAGRGDEVGRGRRAADTERRGRRARCRPSSPTRRAATGEEPYDAEPRAAPAAEPTRSGRSAVDGRSSTPRTAARTSPTAGAEGRGRGRARGDAGVPPGDAGARPALVRAEAAARLRLRPLSRAPYTLSSTSSRPRRCAGNAARGGRTTPTGSTTTTMLAFARETQLSETTFVQSRRRATAPTTATASSTMSRRAAVRRPSVARHGGGGGARARRAARRATSSRPSAGLQPIDVELAGRAPRQRLDAPGAAVFGPELDPARGAGRGRPVARATPTPTLPPQVVSTGVAAADRAGARPGGAGPRRCPTTTALGRAAGRARRDRPLPRRRATPTPAARTRARSRRRSRGWARTRPPARPPARCAPTRQQRTGVGRARRSTRASRWAARCVIEASLEGDRVRVGGDVVVLVDGTRGALDVAAHARGLDHALDADLVGGDAQRHVVAPRRAPRPRGRRGA